LQQKQEELDVLEAELAEKIRQNGSALIFLIVIL
jgi:hypothetical protein